MSPFTPYPANVENMVRF